MSFVGVVSGRSMAALREIGIEADLTQARRSRGGAMRVTVYRLARFYRSHAHNLLRSATCQTRDRGAGQDEHEVLHSGHFASLSVCLRQR
jgi:hypothetical protein